MPRMDGTGPQGKGPLTGRGSGRCVKNVDTGEVIAVGGRGRGCGRGIGSGMANRNGQQGRNGNANRHNGR